MPSNKVIEGTGVADEADVGLGCVDDGGRREREETAE